ncbi:MAG: DUF4870 domain-containing protein [Candidatus Cyclobacteriaceae bacterium M2_1C_046]
MYNQNLAIKIKELRSRKGFSQEQLAEETQLSLRTIQRIENGESVPRGDTLVRLTSSLGVTPDDIMEWAPIEDRGYLTILNLGGLAIIFHPLLGIIVPLVMWILKKDKVKLVDDTGKKLINFQITWAILIYATLLIATQAEIIIFDFAFTDVLRGLVMEISWITIILLMLYLYNLTMIFINAGRNRKNLRSKYFPSIPFLR